MNRIIHRIGAIFVVLLTLWLGGTGTWIQLLDLTNILSDTDQADATSLSIQEGMYGPGNFVVIQVPDFTAAALPKDFDINKGIGIVLQAARAPQNQNGDAAAALAATQESGGQGGRAPTAWVELRVINGKPIGQVMKGTQLEAFDAQSGEPVTAVPPEQLPQGRTLPYSLRQKLKTLHRFWNRGDTPGVYFEFLSGLILWTLLITGLVMYFKLLSARAKIGRKEWFWFTGGMWRGLHRAVSVVAAVFLMCIAFSGTWIGYESSWSHIGRPGFGGAPAPAGGPQGQPQGGAQGGAMGAGAMGAGGMGAGGPRAPIVPLRDDEVQSMAATTVQAMQRLYPDAQIKAIRLRTYGQMKQGVVIVGGSTTMIGDNKTNQLVFNAETGEPASLTEPSYPRGNFPMGVQMHENMKHFHSGEMFGITGQMMNLFAGLSLLFLSISGIFLYFDMWSKRKKIGRNSFLWTK